MPDIYDQHKAAFANVSAYVILRNGEKVATVAFKFPRDGAGRLYAYVHWLGVPMVRGFAGGYGYDKKSAAVANAVNSKAFIFNFNQAIAGRLCDDASFHDGGHAFRAALAKDDGTYWDRRLADAGFTVHQAV